MMKESAIIKYSNRGNQCGAGKDACDLRAGGSVKQKKHTQNNASIHGQSAQQWNRLQMYFARPGRSTMPTRKANARTGAVRSRDARRAMINARRPAAIRPQFFRATGPVRAALPATHATRCRVRGDRLPSKTRG